MTSVALVTGVVSFLGALGGGVLALWPILIVAAFMLDMAVAASLVTGQPAILVGAEIRGRFLAPFFLGAPSARSLPASPSA